MTAYTTIKCPVCFAALTIQKVVFKYGIPNITCPKCKKTFKPTIEVQPRVGNEQVKRNEAVDQTVIIQSNKPAMQADAWLEFKHGNSVKRYELSKNRTVVGRKTSNPLSDLCLETDDKSMSRCHFIITKKVYPGRAPIYVLADANSSNHTYLMTNEKLQVNQNDEYVLKDGDEILAGNTIVIFRTSKKENVQQPQQSADGTVLITK